MKEGTQMSFLGPLYVDETGRAVSVPKTSEQHAANKRDAQGKKRRRKGVAIAAAPKSLTSEKLTHWVREKSGISTLQVEAPVAYRTAMLFLQKFEGLEQSSFTLEEAEAVFQQLANQTRLSLDRNDKRNRKAVDEGLETARQMIRLAFSNSI